MILLIDDDRSVIASLALLLKQAGFQSASAESPAQALEILRRDPCELVIQDMNFSRRTSGEEGLQLLREIKALGPRVPVVLITAWGSVDLAVQGMKAGAADFITKPWSNLQVLQAVRTAIGLEAVRDAESGAHVPSRDDLDQRHDFGRIIGQSVAIRRVLELVGRVAATDASVLITGESGTGKELVAEALHQNSRRASRPFVKVNLGGIASSLFESEMFGHVRGAFTDARADRKGRFEIAHTGTIFLDEIGDLDAASQVKMLRVLQDRTFEVLGSSHRREVDVRVVSATNRPLAAMVQHGTFREDLLYRINLIGVHLPPLRERAEDIPLLAASMLQVVSQTYGRDPVLLTDNGRRWLQAQPWPGNVRQLRQTVERAVLVTPGTTLDVEDFMRGQRMDARASATDPLPPVGAMTMDEMERGMILKAMRHHDGNVSRVAEALGLSRAALYRRLEKYEISA
jgi:DNA-binding NtrC family response regulator